MKEFIDKLIERLGKLGWVYADYYPDETVIHRKRKKSVAYDDVISIVNELAEEYKVSEMPIGWIPCSEKQPPKPRFKEDTYLIQQIDVVAPFSAYWNGECWSDVLDDKLDNVIAWMPLPAPFKEGE